METFDEKFTSQTLPLASTQHAMTMDVLMYQKWRKKRVCVTPSDKNEAETLQTPKTLSNEN